MSNTRHYVELLHEYTSAFELVTHLGHKLLIPSRGRAAAREAHSKLLELKQHIEQAIQSSPGSEEQSSAEAALFDAADGFDDLLRRILRDQNMPGEWERHKKNVQSIVGRWPNVPPKRSRSEGGQ